MLWEQSRYMVIKVFGLLHKHHNADWSPEEEALKNSYIPMNKTKGTALLMSINTLQSIEDWKISSAQPRLKQFFWRLAMLCGNRVGVQQQAGFKRSPAWSTNTEWCLKLLDPGEKQEILFMTSRVFVFSTASQLSLRLSRAPTIKVFTLLKLVVTAPWVHKVII